MKKSVAGMKKKYRRTESAENVRYKRVLVWTITIFLVIFPFYVYTHVEQLSKVAQQYFQNTSGYVADFFLYHKEKMLLLFSIWLLLFFVGEQIYPEHPIKNIPLRSKNARITLILTGIYAACILLSTLFSTDKQTALWGSCTEYEGMIALLGYLILFLAGYNYFKSEYHRKILKYGMVVLMTIIVLLTLVEFFYKPIYEIGFMKYLIAPAEYREMAASLSNKEYVGKVTLSFYNPGYLGGLCAMLVPISFGLAYEEKSWGRKVLYLILTSGLCFTILGTGTTGPLWAAGIGLFLLCISLWKDRKELLLTIGGLICILVSGFFLINIATMGKMEERIFSAVTNQSNKEQSGQRFVVADLKLDGRKLQVFSDDKTFIMEEGVEKYLVLETLKFTEEDGTEIPTRIEEGEVHLLADGYEAVKLSYDGIYLAMDLGYEDTIDFYVTDDGFALVGQNGEALEQIPHSVIQSDFWKKIYPIATGRGYIWVNTIPILKECILFGKGPGNFVYAFLQNEVVGLLNTHGSYKFVIDKPHNWYLQMGVNTGLISLVSVLGLMFRYFTRGGKEYFREEKWGNKKDVFEKTLWAGLASFCIAGLVNDSIVAVNPIFWLLFGIGSCAVDNRKNKRNGGMSK